jgi:hypothetical protein
VLISTLKELPYQYRPAFGGFEIKVPNTCPFRILPGMILKRWLETASLTIVLKRRKANSLKMQ